MPMTTFSDDTSLGMTTKIFPDSQLSLWVFRYCDISASSRRTAPSVSDSGVGPSGVPNFRIHLKTVLGDTENIRAIVLMEIPRQYRNTAKALCHGGLPREVNRVN